jgi:hypothetical protein
MSEAKRYQKHSLDFHHKRLQEIRAGSFSKRIDNQLPDHLRHPVRRSVKANFISIAFDDVQRENDSLLERISEIGKGKRQGKFRTFSERRGPTSLRDPYRRQEMRRIAEENNALSKRILEKPSTLSAKKQIQEFEMLRKYKLQISKAHLIEASNKSKHEGRLNHLPPIQDSLQLNLSTHSVGTDPTKQQRKTRSIQDHSFESVVHKEEVKKASKITQANEETEVADLVKGGPKETEQQATVKDSAKVPEVVKEAMVPQVKETEIEVGKDEAKVSEPAAAHTEVPTPGIKLTEEPHAVKPIADFVYKEEVKESHPELAEVQRPPEETKTPSIEKEPEGVISDDASGQEKTSELQKQEMTGPSSEQQPHIQTTQAESKPQVEVSQGDAPQAKMQASPNEGIEVHQEAEVAPSEHQ